MAPARPRPKILIISFSDLDRDPRVRRQATCLRDAGYRVSLAGYGQTAVEGCDFLRLPERPLTIARRLAIAARQMPTNLSARLAVPGYWADRAAREAWRRLKGEESDLIYANDLSALPLGARLKARRAARLVYDSHEFFAEENLHSLKWRLAFRRYNRALEQRYIGAADRIVTVSHGIARALQALHGLNSTPQVVRNVPRHHACAYRPCGPAVSVLFHGTFHGDRGLETLIDSVADWRPGLHLTIRGTGNPTYVAALRQRAATRAPGRIEIVPAVAPQQVIPEANKADVGIYCAPVGSVQTQFNLPNKVFEYVQAGLCLCVTPSREIAELVRHYDLGVVCPAADAGALAAALNGLDEARINRCKQNALRAAPDLSWEREQTVLLRLVEDLLTAEQS